ncbi:MAG TPA: TauD/TfdA family dioxygenase [Vicinamibacteria bacterium]
MKIERRRLSLSGEGLVEFAPSAEAPDLLLLATPGFEAVDIAGWLSAHRELVEAKLAGHGAILFRGFPMQSVSAFEELIVAAGQTPLEYRYASTPRQRVAGSIYTSTEYPADQSIPLHNEMSYQRAWPLKAWFYCVRPADSGGETPLADSRKVLERIRPEVREQFTRRGVQYVRNYGSGLDLPWQAVFHTEDRGQVESFCRGEGIEFEWMGRDRLRTIQVCQGVATHPKTGEAVWFNQAHLFHVTSLLPEMRAMLLAELGERELPRNAFYGDGAPIEPSALEEIREAYGREEVRFRWRASDLLLVDNMLAAHGRRPFSGERKLLVGLSELHRETSPP